MRRSRLFNAASFLLLALGGVLSLNNPLSSTVWSRSWHACVEATGSVAQLGIHFDVFEQSSNCPMGSYAPGPNFVQAGQFSIVISLAAVLSGLALLFAALGAGRWLRATVRSAQAWLGRRLLAAKPGAFVVRTSTCFALPAHIADLRGVILARVQHRRGPPLDVLA